MKYKTVHGIARGLYIESKYGTYAINRRIAEGIPIYALLRKVYMKPYEIVKVIAQ